MIHVIKSENKNTSTFPQVRRAREEENHRVYKKTIVHTFAVGFSFVVAAVVVVFVVVVVVVFPFAVVI